MFEIFYFLLRGIGCGVYKATDEKIRIDAKNEALKNGKDIYFDGNGHMWYCGNGEDEKCREVFNYDVCTGKHTIKNGHHVLLSDKNKRLLRDYTLEEQKYENDLFLSFVNNAKNDAIKNNKN